LWLGWSNWQSNYPNNWQRQVHQYALSTYLYYLTHNVGIKDSDLVSVFYSGTHLTPQEYMYQQIGGSTLRNYFIDCAAHMTNDFDFILPIQSAKAKNEWNTYADPLDQSQYIKTYTNMGSNGWYRPDDSVTTTAWSFNTYRLRNNLSQTYNFELEGDASGHNGSPAYFQGKVLVKNSITGASFHNLNTTSDYKGFLSLNLTQDDTAAYFIIASMPEVYTDPNPPFQVFPYQVRISTGTLNVQDLNPLNHPKVEIARYNSLGQRIDKSSGGLQYVIYNDGSSKKEYIIR
jgi:hypothetical protein